MMGREQKPIYMAQERRFINGSIRGIRILSTSICLAEARRHRQIRYSEWLWLVRLRIQP